MWYIQMKKMFKKIYIEITNNCNLNCSFCSPVKKTKKFMTISEFEHILKEVESKTDYIYLHVKGEPLLHPNLIDFLKLAEKYNLKVNLTTNGTLFPILVDKLKVCKALHKINFSLHCEQDNPNYLNELFKSVEKLSEETIIIYRLWTLKDGNLDKKSTTIVEKIKMYYKLSPETVNKIIVDKNIKISPRIYVDKDNEFIWPDETNGNESTGFCMALKTQIAILCDGTVVPCCLDSNGCIELGNIYHQSLDEIVNDGKFKLLKKSFQERKITEKLCLNCTFKNRFK